MLSQVGCIPKFFSGMKQSDDGQPDAEQLAWQAVNETLGKAETHMMWFVFTDDPESLSENSACMSEESASHSFQNRPFRRQSSSPTTILLDDEPQTSGATAGTQAAAVEKGSDLFVCAYNYTRDGQDFGKTSSTVLVQRFQKAQPVATHFITGEALLDALNEKEKLQKTLAIAAAIGPASLCPMITFLPGNRLKALGIVCGLVFTGFATHQAVNKSFDPTWGSDDAQRLLKDQTLKKVDEIDDVKFPVYNQTYEALVAFNNPSGLTPNLLSGRTNCKCPDPDPKLVEYVGTTRPNLGAPEEGDAPDAGAPK
jgi:hypothetical protein